MSSMYNTALADRLIDCLADTLTGGKQSKGAEKAGCYPYIPVSRAEFVEHVARASTLFYTINGRSVKKFLDVGCGIGLTLYLFNRLRQYVGSIIHADALTVGIERDPNYCKAANKFLSVSEPPLWTRHKIIKIDALKFDRYSDYDLVYFYQPINDTVKQDKLEQLIIDQTKPGSIIIPLSMRPCFNKRSDDDPEVKRVRFEWGKDGRHVGKIYIKQ